MGIIKITIFQKNLCDGINLSIIKKLSAIKSDFLLLPEYFYSDAAVDSFASLKDKYNFSADWLGKLDESSRGIVIGGSMVYEHEGVKSIVAPVLSDGAIVDKYSKQILTKPEAAYATAGNMLSTFILGGQRFAVVLGDEIYHPQIQEQLKADKISLVFSLSMIFESDKLITAEEDEQRISEIAKTNGLNILRCCSVGTFMGKKLQGRSLAVNPDGVSWRTSQDEESRELIKTVMINVNTL